MNHYIILGLPRSGTTAVHLGLAGHPQVCSLNDELKVNPLFSQEISSFTYGNNKPHENEYGLNSLFHAITTINFTGCELISGAKIALLNPADAKILVQAVKKIKDIKIIFINRSSTLELCASLIKAKKTNQFHSWKTPKKKIKRIAINPILFIDYCLRAFHTKNILLELETTLPFYSLEYQDQFENKDFHRLFDFLGIDKLDVTWLNSKKISSPVETYVKNYNSLQRIEKYLNSKSETIETSSSKVKRLVMSLRYFIAFNLKRRY